MVTPNLTPRQALAVLRSQDPIVVCGWRYWLDGPMGATAEYMAPFCLSPCQEHGYCPTGEYGEPITETTEWYEY